MVFIGRSSMRSMREKPPPLVDARERTCFVVSSELLVNECLGDQTYAAAEEQMGLEGLVALVGLQAVFP
jgi:hypothetical protein